MLRITKNVNGRSTLIKLEGALRDAWLDEVSHQVNQINSSNSKLKLDLSELTFADQAGIALLSSMVGRGAQVVACSGFIAASLGLEKP